MKVINIQGRKKTGKTTTVTAIIEELCRRGDGCR
jgi:Molybdopterin-guanine dinucleotide biosynthesis protein